IRLYNQLFTKSSPDAANFAADLNPQSLEILLDARVEPAILGGASTDVLQFERQGYCVRDRDSTPARPVFNRRIGLRDTFAEAGAGRLLPWIPVAFGSGIALYFTADREPVVWVTAATAVLLCAAAFLLRRQKAFATAVLVAAMAAGFATATLKTARVAHGVL